MFKRSSKHSRSVRVIFIGIVACVVIALAVEGFLVHYLYSTVATIQEREAANSSKDLLADAINNLRRTPVADTTTGRQSIYEGRLSFPLSNNIELLYRSNPTTEYDLMSGTNLSAAIGIMRSNTTIQGVYRSVSGAQACSRQVILTFTGAQPESTAFGEDVKEVATKQLADGRTVHIFRNGACVQNGDDLVELARQVQSF